MDPMGSISHCLHYHPINELEPFFESVGLNPSKCYSNHIGEIIASNSCILIGDANIQFVKVVEKLNNVVAKNGDWSEGLLLNWGLLQFEPYVPFFVLAF
ncbi:hypothetical protein VNO77_34293 [Canavalia gladiata]|uniref:Uncharacterized protein n=1 Tax=Canavalia gladiata TaxID=3824 RepID=A0AAN9PZN6_CANGL